MSRYDIRQLTVANDRALVTKGGLYEFVKLAWSVIEPGSTFLDNWHISEICSHLEDVFYGRTRKLVINIPPGCMKSMLVCVLWPSWCWIHNPGLRWLFSSFDAQLTRRDARVAQTLLESEWFVARWGAILSSVGQAVSDYSTKDGGWRFATSIGGKATGRHPDFRVLDDPIKPKNVTVQALELVSQYRKSTWSSRGRNQNTVRDVIIMQRLHESDSAGEALAEGYTPVIFPMRYDPDMHTPGDPRTLDGELLWPARFSEERVKELETIDMGPDVAAAQLQQSPSPKAGAIFQDSWWKHYTPENLPPKFDEVIQSWDMTFKKKEDSDFVCGGVWGRVGACFYLLDMYFERASFTDTLMAVLAMSAKWPKATRKLVEDKANGPAIVDVMMKKVPGLILVNPEGGKESRAHAVSPFVQAGNVWLPPMSWEWVPKYKRQMKLFPKGKNDDMVDMTSQALLHFIRKGGGWSAALETIMAERKASH